MAKIHKVTAYIVDPNEEYDKDKIEGVLDNYLNATNIEVKSSKDFKWDDNLPINMVDCSVEEYKKYLDYKPVPCDCFKTRIRKEPRYNQLTGRIDHYVDVKETYCSGTRECDLCDCNGDRPRCSFYAWKDDHRVLSL